MNKFICKECKHAPCILDMGDAYDKIAANRLYCPMTGADAFFEEVGDK